MTFANINEICDTLWWNCIPYALAKWTIAPGVSLAVASSFLAFTHLWLVLPWINLIEYDICIKPIRAFKMQNKLISLMKLMKIVAEMVIKNSWALKIVACRNGHGKQCVLPLASAYLAFCLHVFHSKTISWNTFNSNSHIYILKVKVL